MAASAPSAQHARGKPAHELVWWTRLLPLLSDSHLWDSPWKTAWTLEDVFSDDAALYKVEPIVAILERTSQIYATSIANGMVPAPRKKCKLVTLDDGALRVVSETVYGTYSTEEQARDATEKVQAFRDAESQRIEARKALAAFGVERLNQLSPEKRWCLLAPLADGKQ